MGIHRPGDEAALSEAVADAAAQGDPIEIVGGGTRSGLGRPVQAARTLETGGIAGITLYEPGALTLVVKAGTPVAEVEAALSAEGQRLPFEPMDHRPLLGTTGEPTIGGVVACAVSGPRRIAAGACRDAMLGVRFVDGRGNIVSNGGRVMKNVTGYDLVKLMAGQYGTLGVISEISFKVQPRPQAARSLVIEGLSDTAAQAALTTALATPFDVNGAAHLPATADAPARTVLRVEGIEAQAEYRTLGLANALVPHGDAHTLEGAPHESLWAHIRDVGPFAGREGAVWRVSCRPSDGPAIVASLAATRPVEAFYDWGGGLVWLLMPEDDDAGGAAIRAETAANGGHATLIRAQAALRAAVEVFEPAPAPLARISQGLRDRFDPHGILNPGRMAA
ncbi:MAG: glycolate oxidase subunit GlcE [Pseudomonadota bacterium]